MPIIVALNITLFESIPAKIVDHPGNKIDIIKTTKPILLVSLILFTASKISFYLVFANTYWLESE